MDKTCKYNATCGMDFCQPWQNAVPCPHYRKKEKPILFNTDMIKAILEDRKTETRRVVKSQPQGQPYRMGNSSCWPGYFADSKSANVYKPPYQPGDILYVRESWQFFPCFDCVKSMCDTTPLVYEDSDSVTEGCWIYKADYIDSDQKRVCWHPSIHMPKQAARIFLRVKDVRAERLKAIDAEQAKAEGICSASLGDGTVGYSVGLWDKTTYEGAVGAFAKLWDSTIKPADRDRYGWDANPWVWVFQFERISRKEALEESQ